MPLQQINITLDRTGASGGPGSKHELRFQLDSAQSGQRAMIEAFSHNQLYEPETTWLLNALLRPGDGFIDIGGHVGFFTMIASTCVGPGGRVYAFEPERVNYQHLLAHLALNQMRNVLPFHWAVGEESKIVEFFFNPDCDGGHALWDPGLLAANVESRRQQTKSNVFQIRLDDLFGSAAPGMCKLMKIDTEGNEVHILRGAKDLRSARVQAIIAEVHGFGLAQLHTSEFELRALMQELGYTAYLLLTDKPTKLEPGQVFTSRYIYNLLFVHPDLQQVVAGQWPQSTSIQEALRLRGEGGDAGGGGGRGGG